MRNDHRRPLPREEHAIADARAPSHAERCRTLAAQAKSATLSTLALEPRGFPYGSLVTVAVDDVGRPLLLLSELAEHTMTAVDRYGFEIAAVTPKGPQVARLAFDAMVATPADVRQSMVAMVTRARQSVGFSP